VKKLWQWTKDLALEILEVLIWEYRRNGGKGKG
jgi:hypothetical protein